MKSKLAIAVDKYLYGKGKDLWWYYWIGDPSCTRNRIESAWLNGVTYGATECVDTRSKVAAPGWLKGKL